MMMGPNPWTTDPYADCRSMGLTPGSTRFEQCVLVNKDMQSERKDLTAAQHKTGADFGSLSAQSLQSRACDPSTGICASTLLRQ